MLTHTYSLSSLMTFMKGYYMLKKVKTIVWYVTYGKWSADKPWWLTLNDLLQAESA